MKIIDAGRCRNLDWLRIAGNLFDKFKLGTTDVSIGKFDVVVIITVEDQTSLLIINGGCNHNPGLNREITTRNGLQQQWRIIVAGLNIFRLGHDTEIAWGRSETPMR